MDYLWTVDWVWVHIGRSKLMPREDDPLKSLERINDNAFKVDLSYEYMSMMLMLLLMYLISFYLMLMMI
jgi:hypothetical protein